MSCLHMFTTHDWGDGEAAADDGDDGEGQSALHPIRPRDDTQVGRPGGLGRRRGRPLRCAQSGLETLEIGMNFAGGW